MSRVALIGLGEVGRIFAEDLVSAGVASATEITCWDTAFTDPTSTASRNATDLGLASGANAAAAVADAELVISAVTAAHCVAAAESVGPGLAPGTWFFDLNSSSPAHKQAAAAAVEAAGGRYVEAALMSPIAPRRLASPFLLGGPHAPAFAAIATQFGLTSTTVTSLEIGQAAATKLCRSVIVKGLESLFTESLLAARAYGVERDVLDSLSNILPPADWDAIAGYFITRSLQHGRRRAEEMSEAGQTVADAGLEPLMSTAAVHRQLWAAQFAAVLHDPAGSTVAVLDAVRGAAGLKEPKGRDAAAACAAAAERPIPQAPDPNPTATFDAET